MKILIFSAVFYPGVGGIENQTLLLIEEFAKKGHEIKVITYQKQRVTLPNIDIYYSPNYLGFISAYNWCDTFYMPNISLKGLWLLLFNPKKHWVISHNDYHFFHKKGLLAKMKSLSVKYATKTLQLVKVLRSIYKSLLLQYQTHMMSLFSSFILMRKESMILSFLED